MKKISIIIPVYNVEGYLETMAKSLLSQNWENLQVIFSDDGSTDGSLAILRRLAENDPRITVVRSQWRCVLCPEPGPPVGRRRLHRLLRCR